MGTWSANKSILKKNRIGYGDRKMCPQEKLIIKTNTFACFHHCAESKITL